MRIVIALILSVVGTAVLFIATGMAGGACHCMTPQFSVFPYSSFLWSRYGSESWDLVLTVVQFPAYVLILMLINGWRLRLGVALLLIALHIAAASLALHDHCQRRSTCRLRPEPNYYSVPFAVSDGPPSTQPKHAQVTAAVGSYDTWRTNE